MMKWNSRKVSPSTGETHYVNAATQEATYVFPSSATPEAIAAAESSGSAAVLEVTFEEGKIGVSVGDGGKITAVAPGSLAEQKLITTQHTIRSIEGVPVLSHHTSSYIISQLKRRPVKMVLSIEQWTQHS